MSKITNDGLTRSNTWCFIAVPIWQQWVSKGWLLLYWCRTSQTDDAVPVRCPLERHQAFGDVCRQDGRNRRRLGLSVSLQNTDSQCQRKTHIRRFASSNRPTQHCRSPNVIAASLFETQYNRLKIFEHHWKVGNGPYRNNTQLMRLIGAVVCLSCCAAGPLVRYCGQLMAGCISRCGTISSCQSAATSKTVKRCCSRVFSCKQRYIKTFNFLPLSIKRHSEIRFLEAT